MAGTSRGDRQLKDSTVLIVDDSPDYLEATAKLLEREGLEVLCAATGPEALEILRSIKVDLCLVDVVLPGMSGEELVVELRKFNPFVQVILQTAYGGTPPPRERLQRLDIQGYFDKSEGPERLLLWTDVGLKAAHTVQMLYKSRQGLRYILDVTPELHRLQPLHDLLQGILLQIAGLLGAGNSFLAVLPEAGGFRAAPDEHPESAGPVMDADTGLVIRASSGRFTTAPHVLESLSPAIREL